MKEKPIEFMCYLFMILMGGYAMIGLGRNDIANSIFLMVIALNVIMLRINLRASCD